MCYWTRIWVLLLSLLWLPSVSAETPLTLSYDGQSYQGDSLPEALRQQLYQLDMQYNDQRRKLIDQYIVNRYLQERSALEGKSTAALQQQLLQVPEPSDEQLRAFYDGNKARIPAPFEQVKQQISEFIKNQQLALKQGQLLARIMSEKGYRLQLPLATAPRFEIAIDGHPFKGNPAAAVTVVEFADYQCPHCKNASGVVNELLEQYGDQLRVVFRDFPVNPSGISHKVAEAAVCADQQGRFWDFHDLAFARQQYLQALKPAMLAEELKLDMADFNRCFAEPATKQRVNASLQEAERLGLTGTPTFFVNGVQVHVHGELQSALVEAIERAIQDAS